MARRTIVLALLRYSLIRNQIRRPGRLAVCDIGTGCGATLQELGRRYDAVGMDVSEEAVDFCRQRGTTVLPGALPDRIPFDEGSFDAVLALDVIEHVEDDASALMNLTRLVKPGGLLLVTVPAYHWLWTRRDDYHRHKRRYDAGSLLRLLRSAPLRIRTLTYFNTLLFPLALAERTAKKMLGLDRAEPDVAIPPIPINGLMRSVFTLEAFLVPWMRLPFGLSIAAVCQRV